MENMLIKYMNERLESNTKKKDSPGPVITISRECGCSGVAIGGILAKKINERYVALPSFKPWRFVSKEILNLASQKLQIEPEEMDLLMNVENRSMIQELVASFTEKYYINSVKIKKTLYEVIRNIGVEGRVIIIGRGSCEITNDIENSLHIYLEAPLSWRVARISEKDNLSIDEARKYVIEVDNERSKFREYYKHKSENQIFRQITINCKAFTNEQISEIILEAAKQKGLFL